MKPLVKIYALVDPTNMKIRYIGRTVVSLPMRLSQHVFAARHKTRKTHKEAWIRSLLKINSRPLIRKLATIEGWQNSYEFECQLIAKYKDRLVNHDDRGPGSLRNHNDETRRKISNSLKSFYQTGYNPARKTIYVYNEDGTFYKEYPSIRAAAKELGLYFRTISKHISGKIAGKYLRKGKQFNVVKVDKMKDFTA